MTSVALEVGGERLEIELDTAGAPSLSDALVACLPHDTIAIHTQTAGPEFCVPVPFFHWHENRRVPMPEDVGYASFGNYVCFYYGAMLPADGPTNVIGRVRDPGSLMRIADRLLTDGAAAARLNSGSSDPVPVRPGGPSSARESGSSAFLSACGEFLTTMLRQPPLAIEELRKAELPAMGNMAGRLQASGFLMGLAEILFLFRARVVSCSATPVLIVDMLAETLGRYARWLEMSGIASVAARLTAIARCRPYVSSTNELLTGVETLLVAVSRLRLWVDAVCPWHRLQNGFVDEKWLAPDLQNEA